MFVTYRKPVRAANDSPAADGPVGIVATTSCVTRSDETGGADTAPGTATARTPTAITTGRTFTTTAFPPEPHQLTLMPRTAQRGASRQTSVFRNYRPLSNGRLRRVGSWSRYHTQTHPFEPCSAPSGEASVFQDLYRR